MSSRPNLIFVFGDQWRAQATGYAGDPNARTPDLDRFAGEGIQFTTAVSCCPVCSPYRACLMTGQYPHTHGLIVNDQCIQSDAVSLAEAFGAAGYETGYIGKWHLTLHDRTRSIRPDERMGFRFWRGFGCTHTYGHSHYYADDDPQPRVWDGYDADAQTDEACRYIRGAGREAGKPFALVLSWGPPHAPYDTAPEPFRSRYAPEDVQLRPNVPEGAADQARRQLAGYYAHIAALDACFGRLLATVDEAGIADETIVVFTSDHGDMLGGHGLWKKQHPHDESILVPLLVRCPAGAAGPPRTDATPINAPDIMPTLLGLCGVDIPATVEGTDFAPQIRGERDVDAGGALIACYRPHHQSTYAGGAADYRGLRDERYTYCRTHAGPWLLLDNQADPYQQTNLVGQAEGDGRVARLDRALQDKLDAVGDEFLTGDELVAKHGIKLDENGDIYHEWDWTGMP